MCVVLPAPFGPMTACNSPSGTAMATSSVATMPPKRLARRSTSSSASAIVLLPRTPHEVGQRAQQAIDAAAREQHNDQQERAEHDLPVFAGLGGVGGVERPHGSAAHGRQELLQEQERQRADHRPEQG